MLFIYILSCNNLSTNPKVIAVSIIILPIDSFLQLLEGTDVDESIFERNGNIIVFTQQLHDLTLTGSLQSWNVLELEAEVAFIELSPALILLLGHCSLILGCHLTKEVVSVEEPIRPESNGPKP
jgi:hypothetical protein